MAYEKSVYFLGKLLNFGQFDKPVVGCDESHQSCVNTKNGAKHRTLLVECRLEISGFWR